MTMIRYEQPWGLLDRFHNVINVHNTLQSFAKELAGYSDNQHWSPSVDIDEQEDKFVIYADLPGVDPKDIDIMVENGVLTFKGQRSSENRGKGSNYQHVERVSSTFCRRFNIPETADAERIEAEGRHGVLQITLPKQEKVQKRKITIKASDSNTVNGGDIKNDKGGE